MLLSFDIKKDKNYRINSVDELKEILPTLNPKKYVKDVRIDGVNIYNLNNISVKEFSTKIYDILEKHRNYLVVTLHDNDFWDLLENLGQHLSSLYQYYSHDTWKEYSFLEYPIEELKRYSLEYIQNLYRLKRLLRKTPEEIEKILKYFEENIDVYLMKEVDALTIDGNHEYLLVALFEISEEKDGYQLI